MESQWIVYHSWFMVPRDDTVSLTCTSSTSDIPSSWSRKFSPPAHRTASVAPSSNHSAMSSQSENLQHCKSRCKGLRAEATRSTISCPEDRCSTTSAVLAPSCYCVGTSPTEHLISIVTNDSNSLVNITCVPVTHVVKASQDS